MSEQKKRRRIPKIAARYQIAVPGSGVAGKFRGKPRIRFHTIVELEDGRRMSMANYRQLQKEAAEPATESAKRPISDHSNDGQASETEPR